MLAKASQVTLLPTKVADDKTICGACRLEYPGDALFCPNCGTAKSREDAADPLQHPLALDRVLAHHLPLGVVERAFLVDDLVGDGDLADVVEEGGELDVAALLVAETEGGVAGALAWRRLPDSLHVIALATDPMWQRSGVGSYLLAEVELIARRLPVARVVITLSNDNIPAQYFYQRRGYRVTRVITGAIAAQPRNQGLVGFANIPIADELQLSKELQP